MNYSEAIKNSPFLGKEFYKQDFKNSWWHFCGSSHTETVPKVSCLGTLRAHLSQKEKENINIKDCIKAKIYKLNYEETKGSDFQEVRAKNFFSYIVLSVLS